MVCTNVPTSSTFAVSSDSAPMICQAAVQHEQQQNSSWFGCGLHHGPERQTEPQNQIQQTLLSPSLRLSLALCLRLCGGGGIDQRVKV